MSVRVDNEGFADKLISRLTNSTAEIEAGINRVTENPMEKAASNPDKWVAGVQNAKARWAANTRAVSLDDWKRAAVQKGVPRIASGIQAARPKLIDFASKLLPAVEKAQTAISNMPSTTLDQNLARVNTYLREMAKFSYTRTRS